MPKSTCNCSSYENQFTTNAGVFSRFLCFSVKWKSHLQRLQLAFHVIVFYRSHNFSTKSNYNESFVRYFSIQFYMVLFQWCNPFAVNPFYSLSLHLFFYLSLSLTSSLSHSVFFLFISYSLIQLSPLCIIFSLYIYLLYLCSYILFIQLNFFSIHFYLFGISNEIVSQKTGSFNYECYMCMLNVVCLGV